MELIFNKDKINSIDLEPRAKYLNPYLHKEFLFNNFDNKNGMNYYKALSFIAGHFNNSLIIDIGTANGMSALALSNDETNEVLSFDLPSRERPLAVGGKDNISFFTYPVLECKKILAAPLIYLDTNHTGEFEREVINYLIKNNWCGILVMDDILDYPGLKSVWDWMCGLNSLKCYDITSYGHYSGFGIVDFGDNKIILE